MNYRINDESDDKKYFTIIPNYILNHSTATAQALYLQLKRLAGDNGVAYPGARYLIKKLGISYPTLRKEIKYLLDKGWIKYDGQKEVETSGGKQKIKCYKIVDLWKLNNDLYSKGGKNVDTSSQRGEKMSTKGGKNVNKGGKKCQQKKNHIIRTYKKNTTSLNYLLNLPLSDLKQIKTKLGVSDKQIKDKAEELYDYCQAKGKKYKNYKAFLRNALRRDFKNNKKQNEPGKPFYS